MNINKFQDVAVTAAGGNFNVDVTQLSNIINITTAGNITLLADFGIVASGTPVRGTVIDFFNPGSITSNTGFTIALSASTGCVYSCDNTV